METSKRLLNYLTKYNNLYSKPWQKLDTARGKRYRTSRKLPDWCYCPREDVVDLVRKIANTYDDEYYVLNDIEIVSGLAAWRTTQGIYRFHPEILDSVWKTPVCGDLPVELFYRLPEWCCYVETPGKFIGNKNLQGFFVFLNYNGQRNYTGLTILTDLRHDLRNDLSVMPLYLTQATIRECVIELFRKYTITCNNYDPKINGESDGADAVSISNPSNLNHSMIDAYITEIEPIISTILYLCTQSSQIPDFNQRIRPVYHSHRQRIHSPAQPRIWEVAYRTGAMLKKTSETALEGATQGDKSGQERQAVRPHIRRAHWHGYWRGARNSDTREYSLKWLHPSLINVNNMQNVVPVVRQVS